MRDLDRIDSLQKEPDRVSRGVTAMDKLETPDLCAVLSARLERLKQLCNRLEESQDDRPAYHELLARIRIEADLLRETVCDTDATGD
jgi:hypothetical protein